MVKRRHNDEKIRQDDRGYENPLGMLGQVGKISFYSAMPVMKGQPSYRDTYFKAEIKQSSQVFLHQDNVVKVQSEKSKYMCK
jgi:hypothetical protein